MKTRALLLVGAALLLAACEGEPCEGNCPEIAGAYDVTSVSVVGDCPFTPLTIGPTFALAQSADGRRVFAELIDLANNLRVPITADVSALDDEGAEGGSFSGYARYPRQSRAFSEGLDVFQVILTGTVTVSEGQRFLTGYVSTLTFEPELCSVELTFTGAGPFVAGP